jgi:hypothetical protein
MIVDDYLREGRGPWLFACWRGRSRLREEAPDVLWGGRRRKRDAQGAATRFASPRSQPRQGRILNRRYGSIRDRP